MFMPRPTKQGKKANRSQPYALYGVSMLVVVALLATVCILAFKQTFTPSTPVTMKISRAGLQLLKGSDVKMRGLIVGDVQSIDSDGNGATLKLRLKPSLTKQIPSNVQARLIPKTVFGEKYVDLVTPQNPSPVPIKAGDVIAQDNTTPALEIDQALNDLLPLLRTVRPQDLNSTLSAMATALSGRGEKLGETTVALQKYLSAINPQLPQIQHDFQALAKVAGTYDQAAPALLQLLHNLTITGDTFTQKASTVSALFRDLTATAGVTRDFLARNEQNIIQVNVVNKNTLALLAYYSPEYDCVFKGIGKLVPIIKATKATKHSAGVLVEFHGPKPAYQYPIDAPELGDTRGPNCYGLPNPPRTLPTIQFKDGTEDDPRFSARSGKVSAQPLDLTSLVPPDSSGKSPLAPLTDPLKKVLGQSAGAPGSPSMGDAGTENEQAEFDQVLGPILSMPAAKVPPVATLLFGPMARGSQVVLG